MATDRPNGVDQEARVLVTVLPARDTPEKPKVDPSQDCEILRQRAFARMKEGIHLERPPHPKREELDDRFDR
jgi:hypothetical protein